jgi:rod shape-determining protein MreD
VIEADGSLRVNACAAGAPRPSWLALVLQVSLFPHLAWHGIVPNLCLLVVVGAALTRGAAVRRRARLRRRRRARPRPARRPRRRPLGAGPGDRRVRRRPGAPGREPPRSPWSRTVAASSFVGTSVFALTGLVLGDPALGVAELLEVILVAVLWDVLLTPFVLPPVMAMFRRLEPDRGAA